MKVIRNKLIPFKGYKAITFFPFIFVRKDVTFNEVDLNHENIHGMQQVEMLLVLFYAWYIIEYLVRLVMYSFNSDKAYRNISFEKEAYRNETDFNYLRNRKHFAWIRR